MILKKQEQNNLIKCLYQSSTIIASIYDKNKSDLIVIFKEGRQYKYTGVGNTDYTRFEIAESQGIVLNSHIKKYPVERLADIDVAILIKEIEVDEAAEKKALFDAEKKLIISTMKTLTAMDETNLDIIQLQKLQLQLTEFITKHNK